MPARGTTRGRAVLAAAVGLLAASSTAGVEAADDPSKCSAQEAAVPGTLTFKAAAANQEFEMNCPKDCSNDPKYSPTPCKEDQPEYGVKCATPACDKAVAAFTPEYAACMWYMVGGIGGVTLEQMKRFPRYVRSVCNTEYGKTTCTGRWNTLFAEGEGPDPECEPDKIDASKLCDKKYICTPFINTLNMLLDDCKDDPFLSAVPEFNALPAQLAPVNKAKPKCEPEKKKDSAAPAQGIVGAAVGLLSFAALMLF